MERNVGRLGVILVHGFKSLPALWQDFEHLIVADGDLAFVTLLPFGYDTRLMQPRPLRRIPTVDTVADSLKEFVDTEGAGLDRLMLVCHSQGGLIAQRYLARMLAEGRGEDLVRIARVVLFACPNNGSQLALSLRRVLLRSHPQERQLRPLDEQIGDTQRIVLRDIVNARRATTRTCPIPFSVYAGESDNVVTPASARSAFPDAAALPGDHFSIVRPDSPRHRSYTTLKRLLLTTADSRPPPEALNTLAPAALEVHRAEILGTVPQQDAPLTPYLSRAHDTALRAVLKPVLEGGPSRLAILTGESSTGKTRALYQALNDLAPTRPLLRPTDAEDLLAFLHTDRITPGVVLWLNEAQRFLYGAAGERAAACLRNLLQRQSGVAAVGTLWDAPYWSQLTTLGQPEDPHAQARALLTHPALATRIHVPPRLSDQDRDRWKELTRAHTDDPRLRHALDAGAADGRIVQHLSGGPELVAAYQQGPGAHFTHSEHALLTAALDARRLGHRTPLSASLLAEAADGALGPRHRSPDPHWADHALHALSTGQRRDGTRTAIRNTLTALTALYDHAGAPARYEPADYLDQQYRALLEPGPPPFGIEDFSWPDDPDDIATPALWQALITHTNNRDDLATLAAAARDRGLMREASLCYVAAVRAGHRRAAWSLATMLEGSNRIPEALRWYRWCAESGMDEDAYARVAWLTDRSGIDMEKSVRWLRGRIETSTETGTGTATQAALEALAYLLEDRRDELNAVLSRHYEVDDETELRELGDRLAYAIDDPYPVGYFDDDELHIGSRMSGPNPFIFWVGDPLVREGRIDEAIRHYQWYSNESTYAMRQAVKLLEQADRQEEAIVWLRQELTSGNERALWIMAELLARTGHGPEAERLRRYGVEPDGSIAQPWEAILPEQAPLTNVAPAASDGG